MKKFLTVILAICFIVSVMGLNQSVLADEKTAIIEKTTYTTEETIVVKTTNWTSGEFIRIYKSPVKNYGSGILADTHSTVWGKSEYKFYPKNWEPGNYTMIAFDSGSGWPKINETNFTITEPEKKDYTVSEDTLVINKTGICDFSKIKATNKEGKLFIGWKNSNGTAIRNNSTLYEGTILKATYINLNPQDKIDFKIVSTDICTEPSLSLQFMVELSKSLYRQLPKRAEYGIAVLPSVIIDENDWAELTLDSEYTYNGVQYETLEVKAENVYENLTDRLKYNVRITGIEGEKLDRQYTARGYVKYTDLNGVERLLYTDYVSANAYEVAKSELRKGSVSKEVISASEEIINLVENKYKEKYDAIEKVTVTGSPNNLKSYVYQLKDNGLYIREAEVNVGLEKPIVITQISDTHFNYLNEKDLEEKNPTVLSSYDMRSLAANASSVLQARNAVDFAKISDEVVVTGDIFDYLSYGGIELMYKEIWDKIPNAIMTVGNHEYQQKMLGVMPETLTLQERFGLLDKVWKHNINYYSRVIDDKVMLIQLNNGEDKFYEDQIAPLSADIKTAREKGYNILLFMHAPLCTENPLESNVVPIVQNGNGKMNFYTKQVGNSDSDSSTLAVCNIIKSNADVVKAVFNGHRHSDYYTEILATDNNGVSTVIPQYTSTGCFYDKGHVTKITVK